ncbi:MAG: Hpt domain-containing protein, partial [Pseudomonadales bacterium]|nr:Hpt domain-containing protein [Pseudomonadales bacterium]
MSESKSYIALDWLNDEIAVTLSQALNALDDFIQRPDDITKLRFCITYIYQASGSLTMIELHRPAQFALEVEALLNKTLDEQNTDVRSRFADIIRVGIITLIEYLAETAKTHSESPSQLLPVMNQIRDALEQERLSAADFFEPETAIITPEKPKQASISNEEFDELIRRMRQSFQAGLIGILRGQSLADNYQLIYKVSATLEKISANTASAGFWQIASAVTESMHIAAEAPSSETKSVLKQIDAQLKRLLDAGTTEFNRKVENNFINALLYSVATDESPTAKILSLRSEYHLEQAVAEKLQLDLQHRLFNSLTSSVLNALSGQSQSDQTYHMIVKTIALIDPEWIIDNGELELKQQFDAVLERASTIDKSKFYAQLTSLLTENRLQLDKIKSAIVAYVANQWDVSCIVDVPAMVAAVAEALRLCPFQALLPLLSTVSEQVDSLLDQQQPLPSFEKIELLADIISAIEYYLECFESQSVRQLDNILENATVCQQSLLNLRADSHENIAVRLDEDATAESLISHAVEVDDEILDIFAEEAKDVLSSIDASLITLKQDTANANELESLRRAFHTLKGSGRLVGADDISACAQSIEQMLTSCIENQQPVTESMLEILTQTADIVPALISSFESREAFDTEQIAGIVAMSQQLTDDLQAANFSEPALQSNAASVDEAVASDVTIDEAQNNAQSDIQSDEQQEPQANGISPSNFLMTDQSLELDADEEIVEIFIEEAEEVEQTINDYLPQLESTQSNNEAITEIRRSYHTLKGSGRMVGAEDIGEFAWSVERMLNRIIEDGLTISDNALLIVQQATQLLPNMIDCFKSMFAVRQDVLQAMIARADAEWAGEVFAGDEGLLQQALQNAEIVVDTSDAAVLLVS